MFMRITKKVKDTISGICMRVNRRFFKVPANYIRIALLIRTQGIGGMSGGIS